MNLSDFLGASVRDADGRALGAVRDVRLVQDGPIQGTFGASLRVQGLIVGDMAVSSRLGYDRAGVRGPWLVAKVVSRLQRDARWVPWDEVEAVTSTTIQLRCTAGALSSPEPLPVAGGER